MMDGDQLVSRKRDNHSGPDFLSDLPLRIIHYILELVPIREVVRTCILSRRWRYIWASLPHLVFKLEGDAYKWNYQKISEKFFITNVLLLHKGPIHKFRLGYPLALEDGPDIDRWLRCVSRTEIRDISLGIFTGSNLRFRVHSCLYSCQKLTHLELNACILPPPPPTFKGFSCLRSLVLSDVTVSSDIVENLVANSPLLEKFTSNESASSELRISAPNLKFFDLNGDFQEISLYAPLVAVEMVSLDEDGIPAEQQSSVCNYTKFLGGVTNLERLDGCVGFTKYLSIGIESYDRSLVFHHLKYIHLEEFSVEDKDQLAVVGHLMMGAPNLEVLKLSPSTYTSKPPYIPYSDFGCAPNFTFNKLRYIMIADVHGLLCELEIVKYLLKSSPALEKMDLFFDGELEFDVISNFMSKLPSYYRTSPNICLKVHQRMGRWILCILLNSSLGISNFFVYKLPSYFSC